MKKVHSVWCNHHLDHNHHAHHNHHNHNQVSFSGPMPDVTGVVWNGAALCKGDSPSGHNDKDDFDHTDDDFDHNDDDFDHNDDDFDHNDEDFGSY